MSSSCPSLLAFSLKAEHTLLRLYAMLHGRYHVSYFPGFYARLPVACALSLTCLPSLLSFGGGGGMEVVIGVTFEQACHFKSKKLCTFLKVPYTCMAVTYQCLRPCTISIKAPYCNEQLRKRAKLRVLHFYTVTGSPEIHNALYRNRTKYDSFTRHPDIHPQASPSLVPSRKHTGVPAFFLSFFLS